MTGQEHTPPLVSIVCVSHDRRELLLRCLSSCLEQVYPQVEIVVLLNPADEVTEAAIRHMMPAVHILRTHRNIGFFPALNLAIANTKGEFVMTVDDDAHFLSADVVSKLVKAFADDPRLGAVTCNLEGPSEVTCSGENHYIHVFKTGFTMVPKRAFTEWVGYYPDVFFRSAGETFLCTALWEMGKPVKRLVEARMFHSTAVQGRSDWDWKFYGVRSQALCVVMRDPWFVAPFALLSKFVKSFINFLRWRHMTTWLRCWWSVGLHLADGLRLRKPVSWKTYRLLRRLQSDVVTHL